MRLTSLEISGFKSFANATRLEFGPGVTGVIGPNGSGKSNVAEAIRWVLGEQSMKALRGKDRADVLYAGNAKHASYARVTLTFDNESGRFPLNATEVSVSRTLTKTGDSEYAINKEPVRLIDLQQMLAEAGIGAKSYTVISQGMIDQYLTANPEGRRELFNEATGIKSLQIKISQSQQKLKKSQDHANEVTTILEELAPRLTLLQRQIDRYDERDAYLEKFKTMQREYYHHTWHTITQELSAYNTEHESIVGDIARTRETRIQAERQALARAGQAHPKEAIMRELTSERATYALAFQQWKRYEDEQADLSQSLLNITKKKEQLRPMLSASSNQMPTRDIRSILLSCKDFLDQIMHDITPPKTVAKRLHETITTHLKATPQEADNNSPHILFAQLSAVEEDQAARLKRLPTIDKPSDKKILALEEKIKNLPEDNHAPRSSIDPEQAREAELRAERAGASSNARIEEKKRILDALAQEIARECGKEVLHTIQTTTPSTASHPTEHQLRTLANKIATIGERDELTAKEYEETKIRHDTLTTQLQDVQETMQGIQDGIADVQATMKKTFTQKFAEIQQSFSTYFTHLFTGGSATLEITGDGIEISVIPPGKRSRHITLLSGGERALTSIALLFAILDTQKPPFIVLDEVDAALDEANSHRFARLLREHSHTTQSIVISHNRETMSQSDLLYGVTMHKNGISSIYSVKIMDYVEDPA